MIKNRDEMNVKAKLEKTKLILKSIVWIVSSICFFYQVPQLFAIYLSGQTRVDNQLTSLVYSEIPAITICLPTFVSMKRFSDNMLKNSTDPRQRHLYEEYRQFMDQFKEWDQHANFTHTNIFNKFKDELSKMNITMKQIFDEVSVLDMNMSKFHLHVINKNGKLEELSPPKPLRSIVPFVDPRQCFTYFTEFYSNYKYGDKFKLIKLEMNFYHDKHDFPLSEYNYGDFHIALHSTNCLPKYFREETFMALKMTKKNVITFHEILTKYLEPPFDNECKWYNLTQTHNDMRSDCVRKCIDQDLMKFDPRTKCISTAQNFKLIRRENLNEFESLKLCNYQNYTMELMKKKIQLQIELEHRCQSECPVNCREKFYDFRIGVANVHGDIHRDNEFGILVMHDRFPDQLIEHKPMMSWIEMISNLGGLLGMWLGLSVVTLFEYIINKL